MNKDGLYEYAILSEGSYFGDISLLLDQPEEFSYFYNPYHEKPILMLTVNAEKFTQICDSYPLSREVLSQRAREKKQIFQNYKTVTLIKYMRTIIKNPNVLQLKKKDQSTMQKLKITREVDLKVGVMQKLVKMWLLHRHYRKKALQ